MSQSPMPIGHIEIPARDVARAAEFYRTVFNWDITEGHLPSQEYLMFDCGADNLGGAFTASRQVSDAGVLFYIRVEDMNAVLAAVEKAEGAVVEKKSAIDGGVGFLGYFTDISGNRVGLWSRS